jgi:hypothetical protein
MNYWYDWTNYQSKYQKQKKEISRDMNDKILFTALDKIMEELKSIREILEEE